MDISLIKGKFHRNYIKIEKLTNRQEFKALKSVVYREEYKPFIQSFNKTVSYSYLIDDTFVPLQFLPDITQQLSPLGFKINILNHNEIDNFYNTKLTKTKFDEFLNEIKLPDKFDISTDEYSYQPESVLGALRYKVARIRIGTGGGKTLITYIYCKMLLDNYDYFVNPSYNEEGEKQEVKKILIIVPKVDLVKQTVKAFNEYNQKNKPITIQSIYSGAKKVADADIIIGTYQSISNYETEFFDDFFCFISDEVHTSKAYSIRNAIYNKCKYVQYMFGMTATYPPYKTLDYLNIVAMFGPLVKEKTLRELIDDGNICDIIINRIIINYKNKETKNMYNDLKQMNNDAPLEEKVSNQEIYRNIKSMVQNLPNRNALINKIVSLNNNHLILVENLDYLETLFDTFNEYYRDDKQVIKIHGKVKNREEIFQKMEEFNNIICVATYDTFSTGISVNNIHYVHFPDGGKSMFRVLQGIGRGVRLHSNKNKLQVFDYVDKISNSAYISQAKSRLDIYKDEKLTITEKYITI